MAVEKTILDLDEQATPTISDTFIETAHATRGSEKVSIENAIKNGQSKISGFIDYNDVTTATTEIAVSATTWTQLTNDGAGTSSNSTYPPIDVTELWDTSTDQLDFTELSLGDQVDIRIDIEVTTSSANQEVDLRIVFAEGDAAEYTKTVFHNGYKTAGAQPICQTVGFYIGNTETLNNPAEIQIYSDDTCDVKVNGWYIRVIKYSTT